MFSVCKGKFKGFSVEHNRRHLLTSTVMILMAEHRHRISDLPELSLRLRGLSSLTRAFQIMARKSILERIKCNMTVEDHSIVENTTAEFHHRQISGYSTIILQSSPDLYLQDVPTHDCRNTPSGERHEGCPGCAGRS